MQKKLANVLRALARRLDPPKPIVIYGNPATVNQTVQNISWRLGGH